MCKYLKKGSLIALEGRINTRPNMVNGQQITTTEIIGEHISFLDMKASSEKQEQPQYQTQSGYVDTRSTYQQVKEDAQFKKEEAILWDE
jgi:single-strand DNA-binding protein